MKFYSSIAEYYDYIFPFNEKQYNFIKKSFPKKNPVILDIGCATGSLLNKLAKDISYGIGIDMDGKMINLANQKAAKLNYNNKIKFMTQNMKNLSENIFKMKFDMIICLGNTLVHLLKTNELKKYFSQVKKLLNKNGIIIIQILNYEKIYFENIKLLPVIESELIKFERYYTDFKNNTINFNTKLFVKSTGEIIENNVKLNPLRKNDLEYFLTNESLNDIRFYNDFSFIENADETLMLIVKASL